MNDKIDSDIQHHQRQLLRERLLRLSEPEFVEIETISFEKFLHEFFMWRALMLEAIELGEPFVAEVWARRAANRAITYLEYRQPGYRERAE